MSVRVATVRTFASIWVRCRLPGRWRLLKWLLCHWRSEYKEVAEELLTQLPGERTRGFLAQLAREYPRGNWRAWLILVALGSRTRDPVYFVEAFDIDTLEKSGIDTQQIESALSGLESCETNRMMDAITSLARTYISTWFSGTKNVLCRVEQGLTELLCKYKPNGYIELILRLLCKRGMPEYADRILKSVGDIPLEFYRQRDLEHIFLEAVTHIGYAKALPILRKRMKDAGIRPGFVYGRFGESAEYEPIDQAVEAILEKNGAEVHEQDLLALLTIGDTECCGSGFMSPLPRDQIRQLAMAEIARRRK